MRTAGAEPVVIDLEQASEDDVARAIVGCHGCRFSAAGAGPGSGPDRKETVDYGAAAKLITAAQRAGVGRYVISSAAWSRFACSRRRHVQRVPTGEGADDAVRESGLDYGGATGGLTNDPGSGHVALGSSMPHGQVSRDDVAAVLAAVLDGPNTVGRTVDLIGGDTAVADAVRTI